MNTSTEPKKTRRLAAIVFTDVVGYSARMQVDEAGTLALVKADFEKMRGLCAQHAGQVLKSTGDGLLLCFDSVVDAVTCALDIQTGFSGRGGNALQHRIGVHFGDVYYEDGDVVGDGVNLAARLQSAGQAGAVCVSDAVFAAVKGKVPMEAVALKPLELKNIAQPMPAYLLAPPGTRLVPGNRALKASRRRGPIFAAAGAAAAIAVGGFFFYRAELTGPPPTTAATKYVAGEFPHDPDLKRAEKLIYTINSTPEDFRLADDIVKASLAARPNDPDVVTVAAEVAQEFLTRGFDVTQPMRAQAQRLTQRAVQLAPENPNALAVQGQQLYFTRVELDRAEELLRKAILLNPKESRFYRELYNILTVAKPTEVDAFGANMGALFPNDALVAYEIALHYTVADNPTAAEEWWDRTVALAPITNAIAWKTRFIVGLHGDVDGMKLWLDRVPERQRTSPRMIYAYAELAMLTGQTATAQRLLNAVTDAWLVDGVTTLPKAMLLADLARIDGHEDFARLQYEAALREVHNRQAADPSDLSFSLAELWVQLGLGHRDAALAALRVIQQAAPQIGWSMRFNWRFSPLRAAFLLGDRASALTRFKQGCATPTGRLILGNWMRVDPKMAPFRNDPEIVALLAEPTAATRASK